MHISCYPSYFDHLLLKRLNIGHIRSVEVKAGHYACNGLPKLCVYEGWPLCVMGF